MILFIFHVFNFATTTTTHTVGNVTRIIYYPPVVHNGGSQNMKKEYKKNKRSTSCDKCATNKDVGERLFVILYICTHSLTRCHNSKERERARERERGTGVGG